MSEEVRGVSWYIPRFTKGNAWENYGGRKVDDGFVRGKLAELGFEIVGFSCDGQNFKVIPPDNWTKEPVRAKPGFMDYVEFRDGAGNSKFRSYCDEEGEYDVDSWTVHFVHFPVSD
jgi:hypothetical protein